MNAEQIKKAMPEPLPKKPTEDEKADYYKKLESLGRNIVTKYFQSDQQPYLTARRPFGALPQNPFKTQAQKVIAEIGAGDKEFGNRREEILKSIALASQAIWLEQTAIPNKESLTWKEKIKTIKIRNGDLKKDTLADWLSRPADKRTPRKFNHLMEEAKAAEKKGARVKAVEPQVIKIKAVVGKKEIAALISKSKKISDVIEKLQGAAKKLAEVTKHFQTELEAIKTLIHKAEEK